jgi:hypothetical protein
MPFIGEKRKPLTEEARDRAQPLAEKGICGGAVLIVGISFSFLEILRGV